MARPRKFDRDEALDIITETIRTGGYETASVKALSERLGISRSSFYNAFGSREALFAEVVARYAQTAPDAELYGEITGPVLPVLHRVMRKICHVRTTDESGRGCIIVNSISELCPAPDGPGAMLNDMAIGSTERIVELLSMARRQGEVDDGVDVCVLALAVQNVMIGLNVLSKVHRNEEKLWRLTVVTLRGLGLYPPELAF